ncbi:ImpA family metalloprotease [Parendozoicomonas haliclonae]|uniref:Peptidase M60 domain-containing protein n=2 Tax=Parendozoicomonas haliclonae TaxID=1960125 RepID=A0A1X7AED8_9GAMM|nr:hypothetical protein EHSB41UT_00100 [Parendozoicomonas haliclonae]
MKAFRTGDASDIASAEPVLAKIDAQIAEDRFQHKEIINRLFQLNDDGTANNNSLTSITWDVTWDAPIMAPTFGKNRTFLHANGSNKESFDPSTSGTLGIVGEDGDSRYIALSSSPMRIWKRYPDAINDQTHSLTINSINWLAGPADQADEPRKIVIANLPESYYFPDQSSTREWLDEYMPGKFTYNDATVCDNEALYSCLDGASLLIHSSVGEISDDWKNAIARAQSEDIGILYIHTDGGQTTVGQHMFEELDLSYVGDNYWQQLVLKEFDITNLGYQLPDNLQKIVALLDTARTPGSIDFSRCDGSDCSPIADINAKFFDGLSALQGELRRLDREAGSLFTSANDDYAVWRWLILLADYYRGQTSYPLDKVKDSEAFIKAAFSDAGVYQSRSTNTVPADLGNFSRTDFSHITPVTKTINLISKSNFRSTGVYVLPGQEVTIRRTDNSDVVVSAFVNSVRDGATHWLDVDGYKRPRYLWGQSFPLVTGESVSFTSPYGGPLQLSFDRNHEPVTIEVRNVGEHPYWNGPEDDDAFAAALEAGHYDWAELATDGFEVHSKLDKMQASMSNWNNSASDLAAATELYMSNLPHALAGFRGERIEVFDEVHDFAGDKDLTIDLIDMVKHMNADQATCGYGCSGNPYDAYWDFDPLGHGDIHELGHGLEKGRFRFTGWEGHSTTNFYSYFSKYNSWKREQRNPSCQALPFRTLFDWLQTAQDADDPVATMADNDDGGWSYGTAIYIQMMMAAQDQAGLQDGWMLLPRLHILEREFYRATRSDEAWAEMKDRLGFGSYTREQANALPQNDWPTIALSVVTGRDMTNYLETWGLVSSVKAKEQVTALSLPAMSPIFYTADGSDFCYGLDKPGVEIKKGMEWPETPAE